ncbi:MAG: hydroxymethylglutaryl-CoA synthase [Lactobacillus sp.]|nr:hydroxymethylglutaryl-CoA synthase [Lactobacillus sp.]
MTVGIDRIGFFTPNKYLDMHELAEARNVDVNKFLIGIGQNKMGVADEATDAVSMGINATKEFIDEIDISKIGLLIFGTESSVDQSKSASLFLKKALNLPAEIRTFELKEACFGLTAAIFTARDYCLAHPDKTALVVGSDIAKYGLNTAGEVTQGAGAISLLIKQDPSIMEILPGESSYSDDIDDFWRPNDHRTALVDGHYSMQIYLDFFKHCFDNYLASSDLTLADFEALTFHLPFTKMGLKALRQVLTDEVSEKLTNNFELSTKYCREVGNCYTASLYMSVLSLLEHGDLKAGSLIGMFSYGSGAMGEFFAGKLVEGYEKQLHFDQHQAMLDARNSLTIDEYEETFTKALADQPEQSKLTSSEASGTWYYAGNQDYKRQYKQK